MNAMKGTRLILSPADRACLGMEYWSLAAGAGQPDEGR